MIRVTRDARKLVRLEVAFFACLCLAIWGFKEIPWNSL